MSTTFVPIANLTLGNVSLSSFTPSALYCISQGWQHNPLQDPILYPQCYGLCPNPTASGIGVRAGAYAQSVLALWVVILCYKISDIRATMLTTMVTPISLVVAAFFQYQERSLDFHHAVIALNLLSLPTIPFLSAMLRLRNRQDIIPLGWRLFGFFAFLVQLTGTTLFGVVVGTSFRPDAYDESRMAWTLAQPTCFAETEVVILGCSFHFFPIQTLSTPDKFGLGLFVLVHLFPFVATALAGIWYSRRPNLQQRKAMYAGEHPVHPFSSTIGLRDRVREILHLVLSTAWIGLRILDTELQIARNTVLPGELTWTQGQVTSCVLALVPLLNLSMIALRGIMDEPQWRRVLSQFGVEGIFGLGLPKSNPPSIRSTYAPVGSAADSEYEMEYERDWSAK